MYAVVGYENSFCSVKVNRYNTVGGGGLWEVI